MSYPYDSFDSAGKPTATLGLSLEDLPRPVQGTLNLAPPPHKEHELRPGDLTPVFYPTITTDGPCTILPANHPALRP